MTPHKDSRFMQGLQKLPRLSAWTVMWLTLVLSSMLVLAELSLQLRRLHMETVSEANELQSKTENLIAADIYLMEGLRALISQRPDITEQEFNAFSRQLLSRARIVKHVAAAPDMVVKYIYPLAGNEAALGLDYRDNDQQRATVYQASVSGQIVLAGPLRLVQGTEGIIARTPVFKDDQGSRRLWGIVSIVLDVESLYQQLNLPQMQQQWRIAIRGKDGRGAGGAVFYGDAELFDNQRSVFATVRLPYGSWELAMAPQGSWLAALEMPWAIVILALMFVFGSTVLAILSNRADSLAEESAQSLDYRTHYDDITDLPNRKRFFHALDELVEQCGASGDGFALLIIDVDDFRAINDAYGHLLGDTLLQRLSQRFVQTLRPEDTLYRIGGDEFAIMLTDAHHPRAAARVAEKLLECCQQSLILERVRFKISVSIGIARFPDDAGTGLQLMQVADQALHSAKSDGKNRFHNSVVNSNLPSPETLELKADLADAIANDELSLYIQPILNTEHLSCGHAEALLRWQHPTKGMISPATFIPIAEDHGMIGDLGRWVLKESCKVLAQLQKLGITDKRIAINRSPQEFHGRFVEEWVKTISAHGIDCRHIILEITESLLLGNDDVLQHKLLELKSHGFEIAVDDFGTGYSSLGYLKQFPVDLIKIDRSFIAELPDSQLDKTLVATMVSMAQALNIKTIAEGVETRAQMRFLQSLGCQHQQGFLFFRPMPAEDFVAWRQSIVQENIETETPITSTAIPTQA